MDTFPRDVVFPLDISTTFSINLITDARDLLVSEGVQVPPSPPTETNRSGNQRLLLVRNAGVEAFEKKDNTSGSAAIKHKPPSRYIHGYVRGKYLNINDWIGQ